MNNFKDTRKNEIIRVCTSIKTFVAMGLSPKEIFIKTLPYQNGWSEPMREPLNKIVENEIKHFKRLPVEANESFAVLSVFCTPNSPETECQTPDGRVYVLNKGVNQLGRNIIKENGTINIPSKAKESKALQK